MPRTCYGAGAVREHELAFGTSRFLSQEAFVGYKASLGAYFLFWAVYWPKFEGFSRQAIHQLTFWTWDVCTGYFLVSTATAFMCLRAMERYGGTAAATALGRTLSMHELVRTLPMREQRSGNSTVNSTAPSAVMAPSTTIPSAMTAAVAAGAAAASGAAVAAGGTVPDGNVQPPVPRGLRWLQLVLWNIACIASLLVTFVWATEDYVRQVRQGVKNFDVQAHGLVAFFMLVDQLLIADTYKLGHMIFTQIYGLVYLAFSVFWFYKGPEDEKYLYEDTLDWDQNRLQACLSGGVAVGVLVPIAGVLHLGLFRLREALYRRVRDKEIATLKLEHSLGTEDASRHSLRVAASSEPL
ncbi:unnamed protein product [Ectocarpus sp. 12 AP-2014]